MINRQFTVEIVLMQFYNKPAESFIRTNITT